MEQAQKRRSEKAQVRGEESVAPKVDPEVEAHKQLTDELLDQIDAILEDNAQAFVKGYIQKEDSSELHVS